MATDYISREDMHRENDAEWIGCLGDYDAYQIHRDNENMIDRVPAADVVEVVRCRDCKYWYNNAPTGYDTGACGLVLGITNASFFCADGKRRATDGDK